MTKTFKIGRESFAYRESRFDAGTFHVFYLLRRYGNKQMVCIGRSPTDKLADLHKTVELGRRNGEF
jgi:hypothetical protein